MSQQRAIRAVREGFHRHDKVATNSSYLAPDGTPELGQAVKVQVNLFMPLPSAHEPGTEIDWLALTGEVTEVVGPDWVIANMVATSLHPADFRGEWLVELRRDDGWEFPWRMTQILPADPEHALPRGFAGDEGFGFRIVWLLDDADVMLGRLAESLGETADPIGFLPLSIPAGPRNTTIWSVASSGGPTEMQTELDAACSDAVIVKAGDRLYTDAALEQLPGEAAVVRWDRTVAPEPMTPMKHALRKLLMELRRGSEPGT